MIRISYLLNERGGMSDMQFTLHNTQGLFVKNQRHQRFWLDVFLKRSKTSQS